MKRIARFFLVIFFILSCSLAFGTRWEPYVVSDTIPIRNGINKKRLYKDIQKWFESERGQGLVRMNPDKFILEGKGLFVYYNYVNIEDIFLSPRANERTTGNIMFTIRVTIYDSIVVAECTNFTHEAYYSQYGKISFGILTAFETVPPGRCQETGVWCTAVWADMKNRAETNVRDRYSRMVPESAIRRKGKVYKVTEEETQEDTLKKKDPKDYLNIENYLIYED